MSVEFDADFAGPLDPDNGRPIPGVFRIVYVDAAEVETARTIERCQLLLIPPKEYVLAYCRLRGSDRLFRLDRVREIVDDVTGEIVSTLAGMRYGDGHEGVTAVYPPDDPLRSGRFDLDVLTFVASLSSKMRDSQVPLIAEYLVKTVGLEAAPELDRRIKKHRVPGPEEMRQAMKCIPRARADALLAAAEELLRKVKRDGDLDRGIMAVLRKRKDLIGNYADR